MYLQIKNETILKWVLMLSVITFMGVLCTAAQEFEFAALRGTPMNTTGWNLQGAASTGNSPAQSGNSELILTQPVASTSGAVFFNTPISLSQCKKWVAEFEFRIYDKTSALGADGIAFCYLDVPPSGFVVGGGIGIPATANGLKVVLDTWLNCGTDAIPKLQVRWGAGYNECNGQPTRNNNDGALNFIRSGTYNKCRIEYNEGNIRVLINGVFYLSAFQTFDFTGYFGFTASTGGANDRQSIKNVRIFTEMPPSDAGDFIGPSFCSGGQAQIGGTITPNYTYKWTPTTGLSNPAAARPVVSLENTGEVTVTQKYVVETAFADRPGCASRDSIIVSVFPAPLPAFFHDTLCMPSGTIQFKNTSRYNGSLDTSMIFRWNFGEPATGVNNTSTSISPAHFYTGAGPFNIRLEATSGDGCFQAFNQFITPLAPPPAADFIFIGDTCSGYDLSFQSQATFDPVFPISYNWQFGDGLTSVLPQPEHRYDTSGIFFASLFVSNAYCPPAQATKPINIRQSAVLSVANPLPQVCVNGNVISLNLVSVTNGIAGTGDYSGEPVSGIQFFPPRGSTGPNEVTYRYRAFNLCETHAVFNINILPVPRISAGPDRISLEATPVTLFGEAGSDVASTLWFPNADISNRAIIAPIVNPPINQWYVLRATGTNGCLSEDSVFVTVLPSLSVPNAFSPNGDGINDTWILRNLNEYPGSEVRIFDRYGGTIFSSKGYSTPWNGLSKNGKQVPSGVYYYIIDPKNGATVRQGSITVLR